MSSLKYPAVPEEVGWRCLIENGQLEPAYYTKPASMFEVCLRRTGEPISLKQVRQCACVCVVCFKRSTEPKGTVRQLQTSFKRQFQLVRITHIKQRPIGKLCSPADERFGL